jgi:nucleoside-diphosphate kinase
MACPGVSVDELFIGSVVTVYSRQLKLVEYGDLFTR